MPTQELKPQFEQYLQLSAGLRPEYPGSLGAGNLDAIREAVGSSTELPALLEAVYSLVSGTGSEEEEPSLVEFIPGYRLIHVGEYAEQIQVLAGILEDKGYNGGGTVLPLLTNYGSDFICYFRSADGEERVCDLLHDFGDLAVMYDSPAKFLETLCEFYKQEVYFLDEDGYLDCDLVLEGEVGAAFNPAATYWAE
ncbi:SMI1/KNR4 family protein [Paenibacillus donghaensis]|uniref:Knr4/Smi1-like domain-containing protein n=1 Tax=Paenibacillus donghaensis TaxID=414771 RepID=A0A2Z2KIU2_9BACL|nr:SMI1/KNR4 family protein [Paenibacillus donghaensis]ASA25857.1 hypothetical protein B9T62_37105 [Paenibacillus donghaensis]